VLDHRVGFLLPHFPRLVDDKQTDKPVSLSAQFKWEGDPGVLGQYDIKI